MAFHQKLPQKMPDLAKAGAGSSAAGSGGMLVEAGEGQQVWQQLQRLQTMKRKDLCSPGVRAGSGDVCLTGSTWWSLFQPEFSAAQPRSFS